MCPGFRVFAIIALVVTSVGFSRRADSSPGSVAVVVVVAKGSKIKSLTRAELRRCFSGDALLVHDQRLIPFNYPPGSVERISFDRSVLGMSPEQAGRFWVDRKIRGQSTAPRSLPTALLVNKIVAKFPYAISYVRADRVTADVDVVAIDGLLPADAGYPIVVEVAR